MRRSTRHASSAIVAFGFPPPYQSVVSQTDSYTRSLNIRPLIIQLPFPKEATNDLNGLRMRLRRNLSFMKWEGNPCPPDFPSDLQQQNLDNANERIDSLIESLSEPRPGLLVMLLQPPDGVDFRETEDFQEARPICGVIIRINTTRGGTEYRSNDDATDKNEFERSIIGAFCRRSVPIDVAEELLCVTLVRAIVEAICFEEVSRKGSEPGGSNGCHHFYYSGSGSAGWTTSPPPSDSPIRTTSASSASHQRERRFVSINTSDFPLCPVVFIKTIRETIRFVNHIDREVTTNNDSIIEHTDDPNRECRCWKVYRKELQCNSSQQSKDVTSDSHDISSNPEIHHQCSSSSPHPSSSSLSSTAPGVSEFYQFWIMSAKRIKSGSLASSVPREPSQSVILFCLGNIDYYLPSITFDPKSPRSSQAMKQSDSFRSSRDSTGSEKTTGMVSSGKKRKGHLIRSDGKNSLMETPRKKEQKKF